MKKQKLILLISLLIGIFTFTFAASAAETFAPGSTAAYFVDNVNGKDTNAGTSASAPLKTLGKANAYLREIGGGTIVICGKVAISSAFSPADVGGAVTYTSVWGSTDYRTANDAKLVIGANMAFNSDTYFKNINLSITASTLVFSGRCNNFGFGTGVTVTDDSGLSSFTYPTIIGGWNNPGTLDGSSNANDYSVHVYSGTWNSVSAGHRRTSASHPVSSLSGDVALVIQGGTFMSTVYGTGMNVHTNRFYMGISGGTFNGAVIPIKRLGTIASDAECSTHDFSADIFVQISGGTFGGNFRLAENTVATTGVTYVPKGDATVVVTGGTFSGDVLGYGVIGSVLIKYDEAVLSSDKVIGFPAVKTGSQTMSSTATEKARFTNPIGDKPDPYVTEKDGIYYYCFSSSETVDGTAYPAIKIAAHGSIPFGTLSAQTRSVFNASETTIANAKKEYWAPELHYFDAATVGSANAGWYIYFAADDGDNYNHRMYVLRATEPENPFSDYKMVGQITDSTNKWAIDGTVLLLNSKLYFVWSGWAGDTNVAQNIYIAQMSNPWTISSSRVLLSAPTYSWETQGNPDVNEGPQIIQHNGSTHIIYSASGSWDQYYCYGALTLTGSDPLSASSWYKSTSALFSSGNGMYGPGHGTFVKDSDSNWWMIYHANNSLTIPEGSSWWTERSTYAKQFSFTTKTLNGVSVSYPSFGSPAAYGGTQYIYVRTADYHASGDHLYSPVMKVTSGTKISLVKKCYICEASTTLHVVDVPTAKAAVNPDGGITVTVTPTVSGATGYIIYRSTSESGSYSQIAVTSSSTYNDTSTQIGTTYYYKVKQYKSNAYGSDATYGRLVSSASAATAGVAAVPPSVDFGIYFDGEIVKLMWDASATASKYRIFRRVQGETSWGDAVVMTTSTYYTDADVTPNTTYEYSVQDWTLVGDTYYYSQIGPVLKTITTTVMDTPVLTAVNTADGIKLTSTEVSGAAGYKFYRSTDGETFEQIAKTAEKTYEDTTAVVGTTYYYRVRAYTTDGSVTVYSPISENVGMVKLSPISVNLYYDGEIVKLSWKASATAAKYRIFKRVKGETSWGDAVTLTTSRFYIDTDITADTTYEYAVQDWTLLGDKYCYGTLKLNTITTSQPDAPVLEITGSSEGYVLAMTAIDDATGYKFYRSTDGENFTQIAKTTSPTYTDTSAKIGFMYYYRARAYFQSGSVVNYGAHSNIVPAGDFAYLEVSNGTFYESVKTRANGTAFTLLTKQADSGTEAVLPYDPGTAPSGTHIYGVYGDFIVHGAKMTADDLGYYTVTLPFANADAIIFADAPIVNYGDVNKDGDISLIDVIKTLKYAVGDSSTSLDIAAADVNYDIKVSIADIIKLLNTILG